MREKFQCERSLLRGQSESARLSIWDLMELEENFTKEQIISTIHEKGFSVDDRDIFFDWRRRQEPDRFVLRAWCMAKLIE